MTYELRPAPKPKKSPRRKPKPMKRTRMKACGARTKRSGGHLFERGVDQDYRAYVRTFPCAICVLTGTPQRTKTQACHLRSRGAGGSDRGNLWPGCARHHEEQHLMGIQSFQKKHRVRLADVAGRLERHYQRWAA